MAKIRRVPLVSKATSRRLPSFSFFLFFFLYTQGRGVNRAYELCYTFGHYI